MAYFNGSGELPVGESTTLDGLATGDMPVKTPTGFAAATPTNLLGSTQAAVVAALASSGTFAAPTIASWVGGVAPAAGSIVRQVSAGVWTTAKADTSAHAAGASHVWDGTRLIPRGVYCGIRTFDSTPVLGPCWLSATVEGASTSTAPSFLSYQRVSTGCVVTVASGTTAIVSDLTSTVSPANFEQALLADTCARLGGAPCDWVSHLEDFPGVYVAATGAPLAPTWTTYSNGVTYPAESVMSLGVYPLEWNAQYYHPAAPICSRAYRWSI